MTAADDAALDRLRSICLRFPEAQEAGGVGDPTFKVRGRIFAMRHGHEGRPSMWCKAPPGVQAALVEESYRMTAPKSLVRRLSHTR